MYSGVYIVGHVNNWVAFFTIAITSSLVSRPKLSDGLYLSPFLFWRGQSSVRIGD